MYKLRSNTTYTKSLNTLDDREDQNYEENEGATRPTQVNLKKLDQRYGKEQRERRETPGTTASMFIKQ